MYGLFKNKIKVSDSIKFKESLRFDILKIKDVPNLSESLLNNFFKFF